MGVQSHGALGILHDLRNFHIIYIGMLYHAVTEMLIWWDDYFLLFQHVWCQSTAWTEWWRGVLVQGEAIPIRQSVYRQSPGARARVQGGTTTTIKIVNTLDDIPSQTYSLYFPLFPSRWNLQFGGGALQFSSGPWARAKDAKMAAWWHSTSHTGHAGICRHMQAIQTIGESLHR